LKYKLNRDLTAKGSMRHGEISAIDTIEIVDPLTVVLSLHARSSPLLAQLTDRVPAGARRAHPVARNGDSIVRRRPMVIGIGHQFGALETIFPRRHDTPMDGILTEQTDTVPRDWRIRAR
jgi:hypothetical protein